MPTRLAAFFSAIRHSPGNLSDHGRHIILFVAAVLLGAATAVFLKTTWDAELSDHVITFTALFVGTALVLVGFARKKDPLESGHSSAREEVPRNFNLHSSASGSKQRVAPPASSGEAGEREGEL